MRSGARRGVAGCVLLVALAGCGGSSEARSESARPDEVTLTPAADGTQSVDVDADDSFRFHPSLINARPGRVRLTLRHVGTGAPHNWVAGRLPGAAAPLTSAGGSASVGFTIGRPGTYRFVCTIHETQGQTGRLVVAAP